METAASAQNRRGALEPGTQVGRYQLLRRLARGGMAELYLAKTDGLHGFRKICVVKLVLPHLAEDRRFVQMFLHEAQMAATLEHPNIAHVLDIGEFNGEPYFVMQYVRGRDIRQVARALGGAPLPLDVAVTVTSQVAAGLHHVHEQCGPDGKTLDLVHRDVSPANVMIAFDGNVKLVDFGIAKSAEQLDATRTGVIKGKVSYMAPEQCQGRGVDRRTDVFALGILLYEMTTGRRLFPGETDFAIMSKIVSGVYVEPRAVDPAYPEGLQAIIARALEQEPADRYQTAAEVQSEVEAFARANDLRVSGLTLSEFMLDVFGVQPKTSSEDPLEEAPTEVRPEKSDKPQPVVPSGAVLASRADEAGTRLGESLSDGMVGGSEGVLTGVVDEATEQAAAKGSTVVAEPSSGTVVAHPGRPNTGTVVAPPDPPIVMPSSTGKTVVVAAAMALVLGAVVWAIASGGEPEAEVPPQDPPAAPAGGDAIEVPVAAPPPPGGFRDPALTEEPLVEPQAKVPTAEPASGQEKKKRRPATRRKPRAPRQPAKADTAKPRRKIDSMYPD